MTLDNLKYALILNNKMLLDRIKGFMHTHDNLPTLNGLSANEQGALLFNGNLVNEQNEITDEEIRTMVDQVIAELDKESGGTENPNQPGEGGDEIPVELYCYKKDIANSDPSARISYLEDCASFTPAKMNYETDSFEYGSWANAFFMKIKPVMLNYDGTVAYELNPSDYSKKADGTNSDIANVDFSGNAMVGIPTIWFKRLTQTEEDGKEYEYVYVSNKKIDDTYKAYAHTDENGNIMKYTYVPIYDGFIDSSGKLRSISGVAPTCYTTVDQEMTAAELNNPSDKHMWTIETRADTEMISDLCTLISKTSNGQVAFGNGVISGDQSGVKPSGTVNDKGLFYGSNTDTAVVKVFGIENFWGNRWGRIVGLINNKGTIKIKMTYGTQDGSTVSGYNQDGSGYVTVSNAVTNYAEGYVTKTMVNEYGRFVVETNGTDSTYECDPTFINSSIVTFAAKGGGSDSGLACGPGCLSLSVSGSYSNYHSGASCSCKPSVPENILIQAN